MREKPDFADLYGWEPFCRYADNNCIGEMTEDWQEWWECWKTAFITAVNG